MRCLFISVLLLSAALTAQQAPAPVADPDALPTFVVPDVAKKFKLITYGDIRFTDPSDTKHSNPTERRVIVQKIVDEHPDALMISGDIPYRGSKDEDWQVVDAEIRPYWDAHLRIYPALGNHELAGGAEKGLANFWKRFPELDGKRWYSVLFGNCLFIMLDSNSSLDPQTPEDLWLNKQLNHLPREADFVIFNMHHPPYTDSSAGKFPGGGHDAREQEKRLAAKLEAIQPSLRPRLIVIAGHVHNYERFEHVSVTYIVSGGGGATPYVFDRSPENKYQGGKAPTFHYVVLEIDGPSLKGRMMKLEDAAKGEFKERDAFELRTVPLVEEPAAKPQGKRPAKATSTKPAPAKKRR